MPRWAGLVMSDRWCELALAGSTGREQWDCLPPVPSQVPCSRRAVVPSASCDMAGGQQG
jgi:hypothetical protein